MQKRGGKSLDQVLQGGLDERWQPWGAGFMKEESWIRILYAEIR